MDSGSGASLNSTARRYVCPACGTESWITAGNPCCPRCAEPLRPEPYASAILSPGARALDETLTAYLSAPLPEEALRRTANPANLFGKYVFLREIGRGASGTVIKAWDTYLSRHVALKFLHASASRTMEVDDTQRVQEFLREARLAARLLHPNIVQIHEVDCREGRYFISMDFIGGGTLADRIHGPSGDRVKTRFYLEPLRFVELMKAIALAVHHAHRQTPPVVHRDLKPQNVLLDGQDKPYVADFGLANEVQAGPQAGTGGIRGTPAYMAPEQALGLTEEIDPRTDVYSLGIILYEMLTGSPPFQGDNIPSVLRKVVTEKPVPPNIQVRRLLRRSREVADCPRPLRDALESVCLKALDKARDRRWKSALEFAEALDSCLEKGRSSSPPASRWPVGFSRPARLKAGLAAAALLLLMLFAVPFRRQGSAAVQAQASIPGDDLAQLASRYRASGQWAGLRGVVAELREKAPGHPQLPGLQQQVAGRDAELVHYRKDWSALLERLAQGTGIPENLPQQLSAYPELQEELRSELRRALGDRRTNLLEEARPFLSGGPRVAWASSETKCQAASLRARLGDLQNAARGAGESVDGRPLSEALAGLDAVLAFRGTWSLRINISPYAEYRILEGESERVRDFTPSQAKDLNLDSTEAVLELSWPSLQEPRRRWNSRLPALLAGDTLVVSGDIEKPEFRVEHP